MTSEMMPLSRGLGERLPPDEVLFGRTPAMQEIRSRIAKLAGTDLPVLIEGESGTGKNLIAQWIHSHTSRRGEPFVLVNCPAIPFALLESELFGYEEGAFTGAVRLKPGRVEMAEGGTLYLDEVGELNPELQAKLLQLLQDGCFMRIGGCAELTTKTRFICSTHHSLEALTESGEFRTDLLYRINAVKIELPPLRNRQEDIPALAGYLLESCARQYGTEPGRLSSELIQLFQASAWPGNVRQLQNLVRRYVVLGFDEESITTELLDETGPDPLSSVPAKGPVTLKKVVRELIREQERKIILRTLHVHHWNRKEAARALGISYQALLYKMRQDQLCPPRNATVTPEEATQPTFVN